MFYGYSSSLPPCAIKSNATWSDSEQQRRRRRRVLVSPREADADDESSETTAVQSCSIKVNAHIPTPSLSLT
jgi:hypothetical protein